MCCKNGSCGNGCCSRGGCTKEKLCKWDGRVMAMYCIIGGWQRGQFWKGMKIACWNSGETVFNRPGVAGAVL